jgi:drug/metabolite transporter (DMT)-like permease
MGILFAFLTALVTACFNIFIKKGMDQSNGKSNGFLIIISINVIVQGLIFFIAFMAKGFILHFNFEALILFVLGGIFSAIVGRYALLSAIHRINPSKASALKNSTPAFTVLLALLVLNEYLTWLSVVGLFLILGTIFIQGLINFRQSRRLEREGEDDNANWTGYLLAIFAAFLFGMGQVVRKQGLLITDEPFFGAWIGSLIALLLVILYQGFRGRLKTMVLENWRVMNLNFIIASIFLSFGPLFFFLGASFMQVSYVSVIAGVEPIITILLSVIFLKGQEKLTASVWVTVIIVLVGTALIVLET